MEDSGMKKVVVFIFMALVVIGFCTAQNANNERRIVGTWIDHSDDTWNFRSDGKLIYRGEEIKYSVIDTVLATVESDNTLALFSISISSDGKTLILIQTVDRGSMFSSGYLLTKR
jgi:hypothetical protein